MTATRRERTVEYLRHLGRKARYGGLPRLAVDGLALCGLEVRPFYLVREGLAGPGEPEVPAGCRDAEVVFLGPEDMGPLGAIPGRWVGADELRARLGAGQRCLALRCGGELAAFTWCDLAECHFAGCPFPLGAHQAYLFDAYTLVAFRGRDVAPFLRRRLYRELEGLGRTELFSVSDAFNVSALKFKEKLGARRAELWVLVRLFRRWGFSRRLRRYPP